jgi:hypothetical protein
MKGQGRAARRRPRDDGLVALARQATLPLLVWAAHFGFCYVFVAVACMARWEAPRVTATLLAASALAGVWLAVLLLAALAHRAGRVMRAGASALALLGVAWATLPILTLPPCSDPVPAYSWFAASKSSAVATACASPVTVTGAPFNAAEPSFLKRLTQAPASRG